MKNKDRLPDAVRTLAESQQILSLQALATFAPLVTAKIKNKITKHNELEPLPDGLPGICFDDACIFLYKKPSLIILTKTRQQKPLH